MSDQTTCSRCGKPAARRDLMGLCPDCLLAAGLGSVADSTAAGPAARFVPPEVSELAPLFPLLEITGLLGCGGMGAVYKARQRNLDRMVALKVLPPDIGRDPAFAERFAREARALAKLNHPNIVTLYEFGQAGELFYFLMEFVDGVNLRQLIREGRVAPREALAIVPQLCDALQYAHDAGIVHRDIKPENILLDRRGRVKVADFGLAKLVGLSAPIDRDEPSDPSDPCHETTHASLVMGTPAYMAPEQRERPSEVDHRADIYSLGVVFYQMLTGELPGAKIEPPSKRVELDVRLDEVVLRTLEQKPELRYQQVSDVKTMLETFAKGSASPEAASVAAGGRGSGGLAAAVFCILYLALAALLVRTAHLLPVRVASHFGVGGAADGWMSRSGYLAFTAAFPLVIGLVLAAVSAMVGTLPARYINIPRKDFWLIPERRALTVRIIRNRLAWLLSLMTLFFAGLHVLTVEANRSVPAQLPMGGLLLVVMAFLMALMIWVILLLMTFAETGKCQGGTSAPQAASARKGWNWRKTAREAVAGVVIALALKQWVLGAYTIKNDSLAPEIPVGSYVLAWKLARTVTSGDLVVYRDGGRTFAGRVSEPTVDGVRINRSGVPEFVVSQNAVCGRIVTVLWRGSGAAQSVRVTGAEAVVRGHGTPGQRLVFRIGGQTIWGCGFVNDAPFTAFLKPSGAGDSLNVRVIDARGVTLLTLHERGSVGKVAGRLVLLGGEVRIGPDAQAVVGEFNPAHGRPEPVTLCVEAEPSLAVRPFETRPVQASGTPTSDRLLETRKRLNDGAAELHDHALDRGAARGQRR